MSSPTPLPASSPRAARAPIGGAFPRRESSGRARLWSWFLSVGAGGVLTLTIATIAIVLLARHPESNTMPQWVPVYPGVSVQDTKLNQDGVSGHYRFLAGADTDSILNWYREQLETRGFTSEDAGGDGQALRFISERDQLEVVVTLRADPKGEQADVVFGRL